MCADETAVYLGNKHAHTIDEEGLKKINMLSNNMYSQRITVLLALRMDGSKVVPLVIFKSHKKECNEELELVRVLRRKLWVTENRTAWISESM